jgi:hypothetical protein
MCGRSMWLAILEMCSQKINKFLGVGMAFPDLLMKRSLSGIAIGQPFVESRVGNATQTNFEAFYNVPIHDRIRITPLLQIITNPGNQQSNGTIFSGTIRTVFSF